MPQFNLSSATISATFIDDLLYPVVGYVPWVYDDAYPHIINNKDVRTELGIDTLLVDPSGNDINTFYAHNEPINTSSYTTGNIFYKRQQNYAHSNLDTHGRVPYNPDLHSFIGGNLRIGLGTSAELLNPVLSSSLQIPNPYRHANGLYRQVYINGISIGGTSYTFPISFDATVGSGGHYLPKSGTGNGSKVTNADTNFKYTGDDSVTTNQIFSYTLAKQLATDSLTGTNGIVSLVRTMMTGYEDAFPYDNALAQEHFDIMCLLAYIKGPQVLSRSHFIHQYKQVDGTSVTSASDLSAYNAAAYQLPWFAIRPLMGTNEYRFSSSLVTHMQQMINLMLKSDKATTTHDLSSIVTAQSGSSDAHTGITLNPDWYAGGPAITTDFHFAPKDYKSGDYQTASKRPPGDSPSLVALHNIPGGLSTVPFVPKSIDTNSDGVINTDELLTIGVGDLPTTDFWTNDRFDVSTYLDEYFGTTVENLTTDEYGTEYWSYHPIYQSYYADYWQDGSSFFHGKTAFTNKRAATKHGAVISSTGESQLPSFMIGLNESGNGVSKVYMRSSVSTTATESGTTSAFDIADGKTMGTINYGQWNHFAITRSGTTFKTFKNGVQQDTWQSDKQVKIPVADPSAAYEKTALDLSIGRSQGADYFYGYIDGLRISKGVAKYTSNFTVPSSAPEIVTTNANYYGKHHIETVASALDKASVQLDIEYKLRIGTDADDTPRPIPGGTNVGKLLLDAGPRESLFAGHSSDPTTLIVREGSGDDPAITGINPASIKTSFDATEYVSTVEYIYQDGNSSYDAVDVVDTDNPYRGINGEKLERATYVTEPDHPYISREERALAFLNELKRTKRSINLDLDYYDIQGDFEVGDNIFVYDTDLGFEDTDDKVNEDPTRTTKFEVSYQGQYVNPEKIRVTAITWPIKNTYGVYLRRLTSPSSNTYQYINLTPYVQFEEGGTTLEVGDLPLKLGDDLRFSSAVSGVSVSEKFTQPNPVNNLTLTTGFLEDALGVSRAIIKATWNTPVNVDGTIIQNGELYRIRYRKVASTDPYSTTTVGWGTNEVTIEGLALGTNYEVQVQPVNANGDENDYVSDTITTAIDGVAPSKPGPADTITPGALRTQIVHSLGRAVDDQGNAISSIVDFTLENDIDHLNVYASTTSGFSLATTTLKNQFKVGELAATAAHIRDGIATVGEIQMPNGSTHFFRFTAVDIAGNESDPSDEQSAVGNLVDTAFISDAAITEAKIENLAVTDAKIATLSAGKITAGTIAGQEITVGVNSSDTAVIKSSNYSSGSAGWIIKATGDVEFESGTFRGNLDGAGGTFSGTISANQVTGGTLDFSSVTAGSLDFSSLSVQAGDIVAEIAAGEITNSLIGDLSVSKLTSGSIVGNSIVLGSSGNTSGSISSHNFSSGSAGFSIDYDGNAEFNTVEIRIPSSTGSTDEDIPSGGQKIQFGDVPIYDFNGNLNIHPASGKSVIIHNGNPFIIKGETGSAQMKFEGAGNFGDFIFDLDFISYSTAQSDNTRRYSNPTPFTQIREFYFENDNTTIFRANEQNADVEFFGDIGLPSGGKIYINGDDGNTGDVLKRTATGMTWGSASGGSHADSDHSFDNYGSWTLKRGGSTVGNVSSGFGASWNAGSGLSVSSNSSPFTITYSVDFGGGNSQVARGDHGHTGTGISQINSPSVGLFSNYTFNTSGGQFSVATTRSNDASYSFRNVFPTSGTASDLGHQFGNGRWRRLYTLNSPSVSSDERLKENIVDIPYGLDYINSLEPKQYNLKRVIVRGCNTCEMEIDEGVDECWNCTENGDTADIVDNLDVTGEKSGVVNFGFTAQDLISTPPEPDIDIALVDYDEDSDEYGVRYNELIAPLVKAVQELSAKNDELESRLAALEG